MPTYTLAVQTTAETEDPGDGVPERLIRLDVSVLRDGEEVGQFVQRYGYDIDNVTLREALLIRVREIVFDDYMDQQQAKENTRLAAITQAIENWSKALP